MSSFVFCFYAAGYLFLFSEALRIDDCIGMEIQIGGYLMTVRRPHSNSPFSGRSLRVVPVVRVHPRGGLFSHIYAELH